MSDSKILTEYDIEKESLEQTTRQKELRNTSSLLVQAHSMAVNLQRCAGHYLYLPFLRLLGSCHHLLCYSHPSHSFMHAAVRQIQSVHCRINPLLSGHSLLGA